MHNRTLFAAILIAICLIGAAGASYLYRTASTDTNGSEETSLSPSRSDDEVLVRLKDYAREHPVSFGLWALGVGFVLGWKLKPW